MTSQSRLSLSSPGDFSYRVPRRCSFHFRNSVVRKRSRSHFSNNIRRPGAGHPIPFSAELRQRWRHNGRLSLWLSKRLWKVPAAIPAPSLNDGAGIAAGTFHNLFESHNDSLPFLVKVGLWRLSSARKIFPPLVRCLPAACPLCRQHNRQSPTTLSREPGILSLRNPEQSGSKQL